ncbi:hypoxia response transcriptional regulator [Sinomonas notoginsengisoli]|uniref:MerR family transcriptional regulator n=1 Tax=Sinomonas notoginsengisoli TaxID=1457311 RepID=UPI001F37A30E|nr:MerR family transcriptional regulator [Sinomonas notoginsengisoli]
MRIAEAAAAAGTTEKALRYYESIGLLPGVGRTASGYRDFDVEDVNRAAFIRRSRQAGMSLERTAKILSAFDIGGDACTSVGVQLERQLGELDRRIAELQGLRDAVAERYDAVKAADPAACDHGQVCSYL